MWSNFEKLLALFIVYALSSTIDGFSSQLRSPVTSTKALLPREFQRASAKCSAKSFDSLEKDRPQIPYKSRRKVTKEGGDVWNKVKNTAFSAYDRLSASKKEEEEKKKAPSMTPGGRLMNQYKTTLEEKEESVVSREPRTQQSKWEKFKNGVYDSLDKLSSSNSDSVELNQLTSPLDINRGKLDPSNIKPFFPGTPPVTPKKENPLKRTINAISSTAEAIQNIPTQVKNTTMSAKASVESTVETVQALPQKIQKSYKDTVDVATSTLETIQAMPNKIQKSYEDTVDKATATVETIQAIPDKIQTSYKKTVDTANSAVESVAAIPKNVQKSYKQTVDTATNVVDTVRNISNSVSSTAQNIQKSVVTTKKNIEDMNQKVKSLFPKKEVKEVEKGGRRISDRVVAMPRDSSEGKNLKKASNSSETKNEFKEVQKSLFIDDIDPSLGQEVDIALKLAEEALASQKEVKDSVNEENSGKKKSKPLFHLLLDIDD